LSGYPARSSETTRKDICSSRGWDAEPSVHRLPHRYPQNDSEWGWYLAGLIDADGHFTDVTKSSKPNLTIAFHIKDISLAYKIKSFLDAGTVSNVKDKKACKYVLTNSKGFLKLLPLLHNKLQHSTKIQRHNLLCSHFKMYHYTSGSSLMPQADRNNHWLAGFIDGDGSLQIKILKRKYAGPGDRQARPKTEIRLQLQIDQQISLNYMLQGVLDAFGGYIGFRKSKGAIVSSYYNSVSFTNFRHFVHYLDHYSLCSNKYKEYVIWRRAYFYRRDIDKVERIKKTLSVLKG
jgi:LAGLIDADG endonuclease